MSLFDVSMQSIGNRVAVQGDGTLPGASRYLTAVDGVQRLQTTLRDDYANELQVC